MELNFVKEFAYKVSDFRTGNRTYYSSSSIVFMAIVAVLCGAKTWCAMELVCETKIDLLKEYLKGDFSQVPSHDCFRRFFTLLPQTSLEKAFRACIHECFPAPKGVVAIDGKTARGVSKLGDDDSMLHIVSAYATSLGISLGQVVVPEKTNEITAIPTLLDELKLKDCIVTIDAMGCQKEIAAKIIDVGADYILQVKGNQQSLQHAIEEGCREQIEKRHNCYQTYFEIDARYNKQIKRTCFMCNHTGWLYLANGEWKGAKTFGSITAETTNKKTGEVSTEIRYFISSLELNAQLLMNSVRDHWQIENNLHWQLDVTFNEDNIRLQRNAMANLSLLNKMALPILKAHPLRIALASKQFKAAMSNSFLKELIAFMPNVANVSDKNPNA